MRKLIFTFILLQFSFICFAQRGEMSNNEQLTHALFNEICKEIEIDDATKVKLRPLYLEFMQATRPQKDKPQQHPSAIKKEHSEEDEDKIEEMVKEQLSHAVNLAKLREEYYTKFRTLLKPSQIEKMYDVERRVMMRIRNELGERSSDRHPMGTGGGKGGGNNRQH